MTADPKNFERGSYLPGELIDFGSKLTVQALHTEEISTLDSMVVFELGEYHRLDLCLQLARKARATSTVRGLASLVYQERIKQEPMNAKVAICNIAELQKAGLPISGHNHYSYLGFVRSPKTMASGHHFTLLHLDSLPNVHKLDVISDLVGPYLARRLVQRRNQPSESAFVPVPTEAFIKDLDFEVAEGRKDYEEVATQHMHWQVVTVEVPRQEFGSSACGLSTLLFQEHFIRADFEALCLALDNSSAERMQLLKQALGLTDLRDKAYEKKREQLGVDFATWMYKENVGVKD
jgi:hypothetical protein